MKMVGNDWENSLNGPNSTMTLHRVEEACAREEPNRSEDPRTARTDQVLPSQHPPQQQRTEATPPRRLERQVYPTQRYTPPPKKIALTHCICVKSLPDFFPLAIIDSASSSIRIRTISSIKNSGFHPE